MSIRAHSRLMVAVAAEDFEVDEYELDNYGGSVTDFCEDNDFYIAHGDEAGTEEHAHIGVCIEVRDVLEPGALENVQSDLCYAIDRMRMHVRAGVIIELGAFTDYF